MTMGERILKLRKAHGWSQEELADRIGVSRQAISRWELDSAKPDADNIIMLCELFGVSADYLLRDQCCVETEDSKQGSARIQSVSAYQILGILLVISSVLIFSAVGIMSAVHPQTYIYNDIVFMGLMGYALGNRLMWLILVIAAAFLAGVLLLLGKDRLQRWIKSVSAWFERIHPLWRFAMIIVVFFLIALLFIELYMA